MNVKNVKVDQIIPYANNPRVNDQAVAFVASSIKQFGWQQPIVVDKDMVIVVGHTRFKAAQYLGLKTCPVVVADNLSEADTKAYRLADNELSNKSRWDDEKLGLELQMLQDMGYADMTLTGFDLDTIDFFTGTASFDPATEDESGRLDKAVAVMCRCPNCETEFDAKEHPAIEN